jgi:hypothetical protein
LCGGGQAFTGQYSIDTSFFYASSLPSGNSAEAEDFLNSPVYYLFGSQPLGYRVTTLHRLIVDELISSTSRGTTYLESLYNQSLLSVLSRAINKYSQIYIDWPKTNIKSGANASASNRAAGSNPYSSSGFVKNEYVKYIQYTLNKSFAGDKNIPVNGSYDTKTRDAVIAFQSRVGLSFIDGIVDSQTKAALAIVWL